MYAREEITEHMTGEFMATRLVTKSLFGVSSVFIRKKKVHSLMVHTSHLTNTYYKQKVLAFGEELFKI